MILEIDTGSGFIPVACLSSFTEQESTQTIGTTTRQTGGWRDGHLTFQEKVITGEGFIPRPNTVISYSELLNLKNTKTVFFWKVDDEIGEGYFSAIDMLTAAADDVSFAFTLEVTGEPITGPPGGYTVAFFRDPFRLTTFNWSFSNAQLGTQWSITVTSDAGGTPITDSGTVNSANSAFWSRSLGDLNPGTLTIELIITSDIGSGPPVYDTALFEPSVPITLTIQDPNPLSVSGDGVSDAVYGLQYVNADTIDLESSDITLIKTGTADAENILVQGSGNLSRNVRILNISGSGTIGIQVSSNTAHNATGGQAPAASSPTAIIVNPVPLVAPSGYVVEFSSDPINSNTPDITLSGGNGAASSYNYAIMSSGGGTLVIGSNIPIQSTPFIFTPDISLLGNGILTINLTVVGPGGYQFTQDTTTKNL